MIYLEVSVFGDYRLAEIENLILLGEESFWSRFGFLMLCLVVGPFLIVEGVKDIKTKKSTQRGNARITNAVMGRSNEYSGKSAQLNGIGKVVGGVIALGLGICVFFQVF